MLNTPWETGSPLYRKLVVSALAISGAGVLLVLLGAVTDNQVLMYIALPLIVVGLSIHLSGMVVRARDTRRRIKGMEGKK
ncbi:MULTISPECIES: hypothetical protein [unclassified Arthrobacter]|uniref:hypothetical protein n=1 Tax=unclassified Arthrobacter TaxID=235627 RepID=UPI001D14C2AF|nr:MULTISPECIES: hypothetical protein [unclassified Arthrobacter]MCC3276031.1 hypothetical protein [Arthrobacter sp. zg-Y20]MCC3277986.1 hypothetical protein [Arthrobacter sp. zg-Y40]MCC9176384.1 hypothetical protein [Arthrobacter sp. zg-Y750]MDK1316188.1 hypothetical protein [Arthrobacter sp. zg.Y20]MDK1326914.1 hypothetical protein [Arthrobacter sp. zg-Y1143]